MKPATVFLGEMTNPEVEEFLKTRHTVIVPTGATEQHGPHGPLLTDVLIPQEVARRVAPTIGAVVAPPINYALSLSARRLHRARPRPHLDLHGPYRRPVCVVCHVRVQADHFPERSLRQHLRDRLRLRERRGEDAEGRQGVSGELLGRAHRGRGRRVVGAEERVAREPGRDVRRARDQPEPRGHGPGERGVSTVPGVHGEHGTRAHGLLLHVAGVGVLGDKNRHVGRRAQVDPRGRRTLHRARASARRWRCSTTSRGPSQRCLPVSRGHSRGTVPGTVPGDTQPGQSPGTLNLGCPRTLTDDDDRLHATTTRPARRRSDARACRGHTARCCSPTWAHGSSRSSSPAAGTTRAGGDRRLSARKVRTSSASTGTRRV